ncbi:MAG: serine/threonine-protein kinase [Kofleriaceae bacterium]
MRALEPPVSRSVGGYTLHARLGRGGSSDVYAASHPRHGDRLALKVLRASLAGDGDGYRGVLAEGAIAQAVRHPNVVRVVDVGRDAVTGAGFVVMERLDGDDLAARLRRDGPLAEPAARALFAAIADGVAALHGAGVVHRDLKPANVVLHGATPIIVDFGIARHLGPHAAVATGRRVGSPAYMAPEQFTGGLIAPCVDLWALGVMLFEAVTGRLPFEGFADGRAPQLFERAPAAGTLAALSPGLDRLIAQCLERAPGARPATAAQVARALRGDADVADERVTQDVVTPPVARPPADTSDATAPSPTRAAGRTRRRWLRPVAATAAAVGLGVAAGAAVWRRDDARPAPPRAPSPPAPSPPAAASPAPSPPEPSPPEPSPPAAAAPPPPRPRRPRQPSWSSTSAARRPAPRSWSTGRSVA